MSFGKMNTRIRIVEMETVKDSSAFSSSKEKVIAKVRAYKEERHGNQRWANMAAFSEATSLFRFRTIPKVTVSTKHQILCDSGRYQIVSVEDVRGRGMYLEVLAIKREGTMK